MTVRQSNPPTPVWKEFEIRPEGFADESHGDSSNTDSSGAETAIVNVCSTLLKDEANLQQSSLGFFSDEVTNRNRHRVFPVGGIASQLPVSLETLLMVGSSPLPGRSLYRGDRLRLAVILASSVIQLGDTPWFGRFWSSADIILFQQKGAKLRDLELNKIFPYLSWSLSSIDAHMKDDYDLPREAAAFVRSRPVVALGLTLVELCFGRALSEMREAEDVVSTSIGTKLATAQRLLDEMQLEEGDVYRRVTDRCLQSKFDVIYFDLDHQDFQQAMIDGVVEPLIGLLDDFNGKVARPRSKKGKNLPGMK